MSTGLPFTARCTLIGVAVMTVAILPFSRNIVGPQPAFLPIVMSTVLFLDLLSVYLLATRFHDTGDQRVLWTAMANLWSALLIVSYCLTFPGLVSDPSPLGSWPSSTPWLYLLWHIGFPALLGAAWTPDPGRSTCLRRRGSPRRGGGLGPRWTPCPPRQGGNRDPGSNWYRTTGDQRTVTTDGALRQPCSWQVAGDGPGWSQPSPTTRR